MDKQLFQYKGSKKIITTVAILTILEALTIIVQAVNLAKAIIALYEGLT